MHTELSAYIALLLYDYDCVVVPQLGGFVTNYRPARIDEKAGMAYPPGKDIRFNRNLTKNDGLLAKAISEKLGITFEEANSTIHREAEQAITALQGGQQVKFSKIGVLYLDEHRNMRFEPSADHNFYRGAFGLQPFAIELVKPAAAPAPQEITAAVEVPVSAAAENRKPASAETPVIPIEATPPARVSHGMYRAAAATLLPFIGMSIYLGVSTNFKSPTELTFADINPFTVKGNSTAAAHTYKPRQAAASADVDASPEAIAYPDLAVFPYSFVENCLDTNGVWVNLEATAKSRPGKAMPMKAPGAAQYHIIGGCFGAEANATKFVNQMAGLGYEAAVLDYHKGLHRVSIGAYGDYEQAIAALSDYRQRKELAGAWLLKKKSVENHGH